MTKITQKLLVSLMALLSLSCHASDIDNRQLYKELDRAIAHSSTYVKERELSIDALRKTYYQADGTEAKYQAARNLATSFDSFQADSVIYYLDKAKEYAHKNNRQDLVNFCNEQKALLMMSSGFTWEAYQILTQIDIHTLKSKLDFHNYYETKYRFLLKFSEEAIDTEKYQKMANDALDSMFLYIDKGKEPFLYKMQLAIKKGNMKEARRLINQWESSAKPGEREYAYVAYYQSLFARAFGKPSDVEYWLLQSAISDVKNAVMDQASLFKLVQILQKKGDYERAYRYIHFTWECTQKYNSKQRSKKMIPLLASIDANNQILINKRNLYLRLSIILLGALFIMVLCLAYFLNVQRKKLSAARASLKNSNEKLANLNERLRKGNEELFESNRIKEEYIGQFLNICGQYVDKLDNYRKLVNRYLKEGKAKELFTLSKSTELKEKELEELFSNFDSIFLFLFPNFVEEYNQLLKPEARIQLKEKGHLNSELRIFALMRLGIKDSKKIANFMHFSVNTIYNYRVKVRANSLDTDVDIEENIQKICTNKIP